MADRTIRTIGALVILVGIVVAAAVQLASAPDEATAEVVAPPTLEDPDGAVAGDSDDTVPPTIPAEPFVYRIGVLAGISTDNYWAFYGEQASVWNSYILGPTKPALMSVDPTTQSLLNELLLESEAPVWNSEGWRVRATLREDFTWSDGAPITAHDVVYTFDTVRSLGLVGSWNEVFPNSVESIHADSDYELRIEFNGRPQLGVWPHGVGLAPIMARHIWEPKTAGTTQADLYELTDTNDVGGGQMTLLTADDTLVVSARNPGYPLTVGPDRIEYHIFPDEDALVGAVLADEIDTILTPKGLAPSQAAQLGEQPDVEVVSSNANGVRYLGFNLTRQPMSDPAFRSALALLLDRTNVADEISTVAEAAFTFIPEANDGWYDPEQASTVAALYTGTPQARLDRVLDGLAKVGYTWTTPPTVSADSSFIAGEGLLIDGRAPQPLTILTPGDAYDPARPDYVAKIAATLGLLGFEVRPVETDFDTVVDLAFTPDEDGALHYDMYLLGWTLGNPSFPGYYRPLFDAAGELNNTGYSSAGYGELLDMYEAAHTLQSARDALWDMEVLLATDLPYLVLYRSQITEVYRSDRVRYGVAGSLGGIQGRLGGLEDVSPFD